MIAAATLIAALTTLAVSAEPQPLAGKVVTIADGDTLTLVGRDQIKIRLEGIDAPESSRGWCS